jgi:VanZ family protein
VRSALAYVPAALWAAALIWAGGTTDLPATPPIPHLDKALHFGAYGVLGCLLGIGWKAADRRPARRWLLALALLVGATDEFQQSRILERSAEWGDWVADALGAATGLYLAGRVLRRQRER